MSNPLPRLTAAEAASLINDGDTVAFSGFTPAGSPKAVPFALAAKDEELTVNFQVQPGAGAAG